MHTSSHSPPRAVTSIWAHPRGILGHLAGLEMSVGKRRSIALAVELLRLDDGARVLEVGCGPGVAVAALAARVGSGSVTGVDPSPAMLAQARLRNRRAMSAGRVRLAAGSAEALPVDGPFTHYLSMYSASFWGSVEDGLREASRVLVPGARLVIVTRGDAERIGDAARAVGLPDVAVEERPAGRRRVAVVTSS